MLNRRLLRIKVMQALYALCQSEASNYELGLDYFEAVFAPDLNSMEKPDLPKLKENIEIASRLYKDSFINGAPEYTTQSTEIINAVDKALLDYKKQVEKDKKHFRRLMLEDVDNIYREYLELLKLPVDLANFVQADEDEKLGKLIHVSPSAQKELKLKDNKVIQVLRINKAFEQACIRDDIKWTPEIVREVFRDALKNNEKYQEYQKLDSATIDDDREIVLHILKNIILKRESLIGYFEENDMNWSENGTIVKSMASKTIKSIQENQQDNTALLEISANWEEDKEFFTDLFDRAVITDKQLEGIVTERIKNWESDRVAMMDKIILKLATAEMIHFTNIPVKVSINEFIEISKVYSTPKSKQFVNGILDSIANDLIKEGVIKKSGRGLIDNK